MHKIHSIDVGEIEDDEEDDYGIEASPEKVQSSTHDDDDHHKEQKRHRSHHSSSDSEDSQAVGANEAIYFDIEPYHESFMIDLTQPTQKDHQ